MKRKYEKPTIEFEQFQLNESIAACENKVLFGPDDDINVCGDYGFLPGVSPFALREQPIYPFNDKYQCQCYYTAPANSGYFGRS